MVWNRVLPAIAVLAFVLGSGPARSQDISETHLAAALDALQASPASRSYDDLLPAMAEAVKGQLILLRPDLHAVIGDTVDEVVQTLVPRRAELDRELARVWAEGFTEDELVTIATFYNSPAGKKFNQVGPQVIGASLQVAQGWAARIRGELIEKTREQLAAKGENL